MKDSKLITGNGNPNLIINQGMSDISQDSVVPLGHPIVWGLGPGYPAVLPTIQGCLQHLAPVNFTSMSTLHAYDDGSKKSTANSYLCPKGHETAVRSLPLYIIVQHRVVTRSNPKPS